MAMDDFNSLFMEQKQVTNKNLICCNKRRMCTPNTRKRSVVKVYGSTCVGGVWHFVS